MGRRVLFHRPLKALLRIVDEAGPGVSVVLETDEAWDAVLVHMSERPRATSAAALPSSPEAAGPLPWASSRTASTDKRGTFAGTRPSPDHSFATAVIADEDRASKLRTSLAMTLQARALYRSPNGDRRFLYAKPTAMMLLSDISQTRPPEGSPPTWKSATSWSGEERDPKSTRCCGSSPTSRTSPCPEKGPQLDYAFCRNVRVRRTGRPCNNLRDAVLVAQAPLNRNPEEGNSRRGPIWSPRPPEDTWLMQ